MFDKETLGQLKVVITETVRVIIREEVPPMVRAIIREEVPPLVRAIVHEEIYSLMEHQIMPQFELLHSRIDKVEERLTRVEVDVAETKTRVLSIDNKMVTRGYVEDRFDKHLVDYHLKFNPA